MSHFAIFYFWINHYLLLERPIFKNKGQSLNKGNLFSDKKNLSFPKLFPSIRRRGIYGHLDDIADQTVNSTLVRQEAVRKLEPLTSFWNSMIMRMKADFKQSTNILGNERAVDDGESKGLWYFARY